MDTNSIMMMVQDKLPKDPANITALQDKLDKMSEAKRDEFAKILPTLKLKSPAFVFWVGAFLFGQWGVARFMIGDKKQGFLRIGLPIVAFILILIGRSASIDSQLIGGLIMLLSAVWSIWTFADSFIIGKATRESNLDKILQAIG